MTGGTRQLARGYSRARTLTLLGVLTAAVIGWAALPVRPGAAARIAVICAAVAGIAGLAQLALGGDPLADDSASSTRDRAIALLAVAARTIPWPEILTVAVLLLAVQHPAPAWRTGVLGVALLGYLFAVHLVETRAHPSVLRTQLPLIIAGLALLALAVGAAAWPALPAGPTAAVVRVVAVSAAVVVGVLVVPVWLRGQREQ